MTAFLTTLAAHPIIILFLFLNLAIGFWAHSKSKANSFEDYALASRSLPTGVLVMTLLGTVLNMATLANTGLADYYGILQFGMVMAHFLNFIMMGTFIAPFLVHFSSCNTLGDLAVMMYGRSARIFAGLISCVVCILITIVQMQAIGRLGQSLLSLSPSSVIVCFGGVIVLYSVWGGMRSVSYTDVFQVVAALLTIGWLIHIVIQRIGGIENVFKGLSEDKMTIIAHPDFLIRQKEALFWQVVPVYMLTPPIIQRMLVTHEKRQVRKTWYTTAVLYIIIMSVITFIGICIASQRDKFPVAPGKVEGLLVRVIKYCFDNQPLTLDLLFLGLLAIGFSTVDSFLHAIGITITQDIISPVREICKLKPLNGREKVTYAKLGISLVGTLIILGTLLMGANPLNLLVMRYGVLFFSLIIIPVIIGIIGIKTDRTSWIGFCLVYSSSVIVLKFLGWEIIDYFLTSLPLGILAYFLTHIYINGGIVTLKRSEQTIAEQLWIPTWQGSVEYLKSWLLAPFRLHILASRKIVNNPTQSLSFSMLIFALYTFSSVMTGGSNDLGIANFMAGVHLVGITLCVGLMLEGIWPDRLKPYFALYWFFTLFYCLAFGSTLTFLREHEDMMAVIKWFFNFMLLAFLVDSISFITLTCLGSSLAMGVWYAVFRSIPSDVLGSIGLPGIYLLAGLLVAVLLFASSREQHVNQRFDWNRTASSALGHDLRLTVGMLEGVGRALENAFKVSESMTNTKGEKGYWVPQGQAAFLGSFSEKMIERGAMAGKEIQDFSDFIKSQVVGIFEQKKTGMRAAAEEAIHKLEDKMPSTVKMKVSGKKDFSPKVLSGVFTNVFYNLLWNAATHGKASEVEIRIDGDKRTITVLDNGKGIPSDILPRIFDLNFSTGMKRTKNSGVGLAFVKMVIAASSGKISCHSRHGDKDSFTEFVMEFPEV